MGSSARRRAALLTQTVGVQISRAMLLTLFVMIGSAASPRAVSHAQDPAAPPEDSLVLSTEGPLPLSDLVEYVSQRLNIRFLFDESLRERRVNLIAPDPIPVSNLLDVMQTILLAEGFVVTETDAAGVRQITTADRIPEVARPRQSVADLSEVGAAVPVTRLFQLSNTDPANLVELVRPFLSKTGASIIAMENRKFIIVTDVAANVRRIAELVEILDTGSAQVEVRFVEARNIRADELAEQLRELLLARARALGRGEEETTGVEVLVDSRTNKLILVGTEIEIERAERLLETLDTALPTLQQTFSVEFISPERLDEVIREILDGRAISPPYRARVEGNVLIVDSTREVLELVGRIRRSLDTREAPLSQSPVRFYKIKNVPAQELAETIQSIGGQSSLPSRRGLPDRRRTSNDAAVPGPNVSPLAFPGAAQPVRVPPTPPAVRDEQIDPSAATALDADLPIEAAGRDRSGLQASVDGQDPATTSLPGNADIAVDVHTNTIIIVAEPQVQRIYATLIETLDQRRPQVLIEAKIVIIDTSDDYTLGVEVSGGDRSGARRLFAFSSYGLSDVDPVTGALQILPGIGFNGTLVDPSTADVVVRAVANHRRARVLSTPRVLVNDNAEGQLTSVLEVPFTSVNASQTVATTSFAGFAEAGTTITVTPTISDDNYLQLEYVVTLNSFSGTGSAGVPPPRQTNEVRSRVTVPDGYTVIVGGLVSKNGAFEVDTIPWLERIPVIRDLASLQTKSQAETSLFVFLRPVILREDKFKDLKFFSDVDLHKAALPGNYPVTQPLTIE